jgi:uncharacterized NAD-dependent epimerase/dehydratase family protein
MSLECHAIVYCEGAFNTPNGKTAHGLIRMSKRYSVTSVLDSNYSGRDAGDVLDGKKKGIPVLASLDEAIRHANGNNIDPGYLIIGIAPDGGAMTPQIKQVILEAISKNLNIVCGLHDFMNEDQDIVRLASRYKVEIKDVRQPPDRKELHFFSGKIREVTSLKIAVLGTDSAIGKRTTAWIIVDSLNKLGVRTELIGTGQTAWMQGSRYGLMLDSLVSDFISGEIEHAVWSAWSKTSSDVIVIEGQGSLLNPAYPGGFEILAAARPDLIILQHAPARKEYDGFPGYMIHPLKKQIQAIELISDKPVIAITINHEDMPENDIEKEIEKIRKEVNIPAFDVLLNEPDELNQLILSQLKEKNKKKHSN